MSNEDSGVSAADDLDLFEAEATGQPVQTTNTTAPNKYEGKSVEDLIKMHQNAEKLIARHGQEVATLRRTADQLLDLKRPAPVVKEEPKPITVNALLEDPDKTLKTVLDAEITRRTEDSTRRLNDIEARISQVRFEEANPNYVNDANDPEFISWVQKNKLRSALGAQAAANNFDAAAQLWELWGEHKELTGKTSNKTAGDKKSAPRTVKSAPNTSNPEPRYSRAKLMELRMRVADGEPAAVARWNDPKFQANLIKAYQEDRVV